jgi:hypothetical protein
VTAPALAQTSPEGHRVYVWQGRAYPSVTAILAGGVPKPFLPAAAVPFLAAFDRFTAEHEPGWLASEQTVVSRRYGYAGTLDALCTLGGRVTLLDVKTGRGVYPEACLQLAAYAHADFTGHPDGRTEQPLPAIQAGAVLHLRPGGYRLVPVPVGQAVLEAFLAARAVFCWATELAPAVLPTAPTTGPHREETS